VAYLYSLLLLGHLKHTAAEFQQSYVKSVTALMTYCRVSGLLAIRVGLLRAVL